MSEPIMVLNDGETFTNVNGCAITIPIGDTIEEMEESLDEETDQTVVYFSYGNGRVYICIEDESKVSII